MKKQCEGCAYAFKSSIDKRGKAGCKAFKEIIENCWNYTKEEEKKKRDEEIRKYLSTR